MKLGDKLMMTAGEVSFGDPMHIAVITVDICDSLFACLDDSVPNVEDRLCELLARGLMDRDLVGYEPSLKFSRDQYYAMWATILAFRWPQE